MDCVTSKLVHPTMHPPNKHITINGVTKFMNKYGLQLVLYETTTIYKTQIDQCVNTTMPFLDQLKLIG